MLDVNGVHPVQVLRDGAQDFHEAGLQGGYGHCAAHQNDARVPERHQTELHHQVGDGRGRQSGESPLYEQSKPFVYLELFTRYIRIIKSYGII